MMKESSLAREQLLVGPHLSGARPMVRSEVMCIKKFYFYGTKNKSNIFTIKYKQKF